MKTLNDKRFNSILMEDGSIPIFRNPRYLYDEDDVIKALIKFKSHFTPKSKDFMEVTMFRPQEIENYLFELFGKELFALHEQDEVKK